MEKQKIINVNHYKKIKKLNILKISKKEKNTCKKIN